MPDATTTQQPGTAAAQGTGALDAAAVQKLVTDTVTAALKPLGDSLGELAKNQKVFADTLMADAAKAAEAAKAKTDADKKTDAPKPITLEDVQSAITNSLTSAFKTRDDAAATSTLRNSFIGEKMKDLPPTYQSQLGNDPAKWPTEEQAIRDRFRAEMAAAGFKVPDVGAGNAGGETGSGGKSQTQPNQAKDLAARGALSKGQAAFASSITLPK